MHLPRVRTPLRRRHGRPPRRRPHARNTDIGPLATPQIVDELLQQVTLARESGGRVLTGGARALVEAATSATTSSPPSSLASCRNAPICQEEIFGPVALLFRVASLDEAIALANDTPFGLAASAWTSDDAERQRLAVELQCGAVFFNTTVASDPRLPFGGIKHSGYGRELAAVGMREFLNAKTVVVAEPSAETYPTPPEPSKAQAKPELTSEPQPDTPSDKPSDKPSEFQHLAEQLRKFEPPKPAPPSADPITPAPLPAEPIQPEPIHAETPPPDAPPSELNPQDPPKDDDTPPPTDGSMLHLR